MNNTKLARYQVWLVCNQTQVSLRAPESKRHDPWCEERLPHYCMFVNLRTTRRPWMWPCELCWAYLPSSKRSHSRNKLFPSSKHQNEVGESLLKLQSIFHRRQQSQSGSFDASVRYLWSLLIYLNLLRQERFEGGIEPQLEQPKRPSK